MVPFNIYIYIYKGVFVILSKGGGGKVRRESCMMTLTLYA